MSKTNIILDTDMGSDIDDALALLLLNSLVVDGECNLAGIVVNKGNHLAPAYTDLINRFCGIDNVPTGWLADAPAPQKGRFLRPVLEEMKKTLSYDYNKKEWPDAVRLLRKTLGTSQDNSVVYVAIGGCSIFSRFLESRPDDISDLGGIALAKKKIKFVSIMAGNFSPEIMLKPCVENNEYNIRIDISAARNVCDSCPVPMVFSGFEIGKNIVYPKEAINSKMNWTDFHPVKEGYKLFCGLEHARPTWDLTSVLHGIYPDAGFFDISTAGKVQIDAVGHTTFKPMKNGLHKFLKLKSNKKYILDIFIKHCSRSFSTAKTITSS